MDEMYTTVQTACRMANYAHKKEQRQHIVFREVGLYRIKPAEEIQEIREAGIYGWTVPSWRAFNDADCDKVLKAKQAEYPKGSDPFVRPLFENEIYWGVDQIETKVVDRLSKEEVYSRRMEALQKRYRRR